MCDQCQALMINGVLCHETGCPISWKDYDRECAECGETFKPEHQHQQHCCDECSNGADNDQWGASPWICNNLEARLSTYWEGCGAAAGSCNDCPEAGGCPLARLDDNDPGEEPSDNDDKEPCGAEAESCGTCEKEECEYYDYHKPEDQDNDATNQS